MVDIGNNFINIYYNTINYLLLTTMDNNYIINKIIGVDDITGLNIELRVKELLIEAHKQKNNNKS